MTWIEKERFTKNYITHKHLNNPSFKDVKYLFVLFDDLSESERPGNFPGNIIEIDVDYFYEWLKPRITIYVKKKNFELELDIFYKQFVLAPSLLLVIYIYLYKYVSKCFGLNFSSFEI
ncbi:MAG: hypothetical protein ACTSYF_06675 [Promethearchaeota archaeon]